MVRNILIATVVAILLGVLYVLFAEGAPEQAESPPPAAVSEPANG